MERFSRANFDCNDDEGRVALSMELTAVLSERLKSMPDFHQGVRQFVSELRSLGHDLWSFDDSDEMEVWGPDYQNPSGPGIVVTFRTDGVEVEYSKMK